MEANHDNRHVQRLTVYTLVRISSMNPSEGTKQAKLLDFIKALESWKVWDDTSVLANHQTVRDWLLACLKSINTVHQIRYHHLEVRFHSTCAIFNQIAPHL